MFMGNGIYPTYNMGYGMSDAQEDLGNFCRVKKLDILNNVGECPMSSCQPICHIASKEEIPMKLGSVRELKQSLSESILSRVVQSIRSRSAFGVAGKALSALRTTPRSLALGIASKGKGFRLALRLQHRAMENSPEVESIRKQARGEVDVRYVGRILKLAKPWHQKRNRTLLIGGSVGHFNITAGTLGCFVRARSGGGLHILSNNHVLADENQALIGDAILQPGAFDGGQNPKDVIGKLAKFEELRWDGVNFVDCAIASINDGIKANVRKLEGLGSLAGVGPAFLDAGAKTAKVGRTTGLTRGRVTAFELDNVVVGYDLGNLRFDNQIEIEGVEDGPFSQGGDSGSVIINEESKAVALLFAGGDQGGANGQGLTYASPIQTVLDALDVEMVF